MKKKTALIAGATGLTGPYVLKELLADDDFEKVKVLTRRSLGKTHTKLDQVLIDFEELDQSKNELGADVVFCCLGTTIKKAGSKEAFEKVDYTYVKQLAEFSREQGAERFLLQSSLGADAKSANFYLRTKGKVEDAIKEMNFPTYIIYRPSMLLGPRKESRMGEDIGKFFMKILDPLMIGGLKKYRGIHAKQVAHAMVVGAKLEENGFMIFESDKIAEID